MSALGLNKENIQKRLNNASERFATSAEKVAEQMPGDLFAAAMLELVGERFAVLVHPQPNDMDVVAVDVLMFIYHVGLIAIS